MFGSLILIALGVVGCTSGGSNAGKPKVAIVTNCTDPFWDICQAGAMKGAADFDVDVTFKQPAQGTVDAQMKIVDDMLKLGIQGLAVSVINPKEQTPKLKVIAQDLPQSNFITMDNDAVDSGRLCYVGVDNYEAGKEAGRMVKRARPNGGTVALFIGNTDSANAQARTAGVLSELADRDVRADVAAGKYEDKYGKYTFHRKQPITDDMKQDKALSNAADTLEQLQGTPDVCMVGLYAYNPAKILEAARKKSLVGKIKIVAFDEDLTTLDGIDKGEIEGSVSQDPYNYGYDSVRWLAHVIRNKPKSELPQKGTPYSIITRDGQTPNIPGIKNRKAADYLKTINEAIKK